MSRRARYALAAASALAIGVLLTAIVLAQGSAEDSVQTGESITVAAGQTVDHNLYAFGRTVTIDGTLNGDLVAAGVDVIVNGTVTGDILGAANNVTIQGKVTGDVRAAAEDILITGGVGGDVAVACGTLTITGSGTVGGNLLFLAGDVTVDGAVTGDIYGNATTYARHGSLGGTESVTLGGSQGDQPAADATAAKAIDAIRQFVIVVLLGALWLWFGPRLLRASATTVRSRPLASLGGGFLVLIGLIVLVISIIIGMSIVAIGFAPLGFDALIAFDVVGGLLAVFGVLFGLLFFASFLGDAVVGLALGRVAARGDHNRPTELLWLAVGAAIVVLITSFPVVGAWLKFVVILLALGGVGLAIRERQRGPVLPPPIAPPEPAGDGWR